MATNKGEEADDNPNSSQNKKEKVCPKCGAKVSPEDELCPNCGANLEEELESQEINVSQRYPALRIISGIYLVLGVVVISITVVISVAVLGNGTGFSGMSSGISFIFILTTGGITGLGLVAASEVIKVFIAIEANTRKTAEIIERMNRDEK